MELTPELLLEAKFGPSRRGYDMEEVDDFLERVAAGLEELQRRLTDEFTRAEVAEADLVALRSTAPPAAPRSAPEADPVRADPSESMRILIHAERTAEAVISEARAEAERIVAEAAERASSDLEEATQVLNRARAESESEARRAGEMARRSVEAEVLSLRAQRDSVSDEVRSLTRRLDEQRSRVRTTVLQLQRLLEDPESLRDTQSSVDAAAPWTETADSTTEADLAETPETGEPSRAETDRDDFDGEPTQAVPPVAAQDAGVVDVTERNEFSFAFDPPR